MSHQIEETDAQWGTDMAWHKLTVIKPELSLEENWLTQWDVKPVELVTINEENAPVPSGYSILRCTDNGKHVGKPFDPSTYTVIDNKTFLELLKKSFAGTKIKVVSTVSMQNRNLVAVSIRLDNLKDFKVAGREFEAYLNMGNGLANGMPLWARTGNHCVVCKNTFDSALVSGGKEVAVRYKHSKNMSAQIENLPQIIDAAIGVQREFAEAFNSLAKVPCGLIQAERVFTGFLTSENDLKRAKELGKSARQSDVISTRSKNTAARLTELFSRGAGNRGKDFADVFSAVTDFYTHESSGGDNAWKQFESSEFGSGLRKKQEFFELVTVPKSRDTLEERGARVLELPALN
ncbi:MAG TPA: DUF932 domain-containing protein [Flavobacteriales bacterium]|nr:DUF932 domain-containing protein [Flavobacteriales bacterium]